MASPLKNEMSDESDPTSTEVAPPFSEPPHFSGKFIRAWITDPIGVVTFIASPSKMPVEDAELLAGHVMGAVRRLNPNNEPISFYHDWRNSQGLPAESRDIVVQIVKDLGKPMVKKIRVEIENVSAGRRLVAQTIMMTLRILGHDVAVIDDVLGEIREGGVRPRRM